MCFVTWDVGNVIGGIVNWACSAGVIDVIYTCKSIVQIVEDFDFVGVGRLLISCSFVYSLATCSVSSTSAHGFLLLVCGGLVLVCHIWVLA